MLDSTSFLGFIIIELEWTFKHVGTGMLQVVTYFEGVIIILKLYFNSMVIMVLELKDTQ